MTVFSVVLSQHFSDRASDRFLSCPEPTPLPTEANDLFLPVVPSPRLSASAHEWPPCVQHVLMSVHMLKISGSTFGRRMNAQQPLTWEHTDKAK